jgi:rhodanese-related sulfurtransferase
VTEVRSIDSKTLAAWLSDGGEMAMLDLREAGLFGEGHAFFASNIPYSRLELDAERLVPLKDTRIVLAGEEGTDTLGEHRLQALGYTNVHQLLGGVDAWAKAGHPLFTSVYVPSKAFAEVVEHHFHTPALAAADLKELLDARADVVVLDSRTVEEFERFHVPGAVSCPSAELVYRFNDLVPSPDTFVVVSCAGRTRGIIGAQALINAGVPNRVASLAGGTQGWKLAGFSTEKGLTAVYGSPTARAAEEAKARAAAIARRFGVPIAGFDDLRGWRGDAARTTYLFDVRTPEEYAAGHIEGAVSIPGGQLVQSLDAWAATRGARIALLDDALMRAVVTAHWLRQLGWDAVAVGYDPASVPLEIGAPAANPPKAALSPAPQISASEAKRLLDAGAAAIVSGSSAAFREAHPEGAAWVNRSRLAHLAAAPAKPRQLLIFGSDTAVSQLVALDLIERNPGQDAFVVRGDTAAWRAAGIPIVASPNDPPDEWRIDFLFWLHDRHTGNAEASRAYLAWEGDLPRQIGSPEAAGYRLAASAPAVQPAIAAVQ